jgi:iron complex outermembrane receptor protein
VTSLTFALKYQLTQRIGLYTSYGLSFNPPADNEMDSPVVGYLYNQGLNAQKSGNFELGIKGNFSRVDSSSLFRRVRFDASFFNMKVENEIVPYEEFGDLFYRNAAKSNHLGFNLRGSLEIYKYLNFEFLYTFCRFSYGSYTAISLLEDSTGTIITTTRDFTGKNEPNVPKNYLSLSLSYSHPVFNKINIFARLGYLGISGLWVDDGNTDKTNSSNLLNTILGIDAKFGHFIIILSGGINNIFNEKYVEFQIQIRLKVSSMKQVPR